ncbi:MAG: HD domain-containing protein [Desulfitobacteriaceae bacterium]
MERINQVIQGKDFQQYLQKTAELEQQRLYCKHGFDHLLAVARIACVYLLEHGENNFEKEIVYSAAILHDLGRWVEYQTGEDHAVVSARLAGPLLEENGFAPEEVRLILQAILEHRKHRDECLSPLGKALALADDWARDCWNCAGQDTCHKFKPEMLAVKY